MSYFEEKLTEEYLISKTYNYFEDTNPEYKNAKFAIDERIDPDKSSKKLYYALWRSFFYSKSNDDKIQSIQIIVGTKNNDSWLTLSVNDKEFLLSSDYIGPSIYWARELGKVDKDIIEFLKTSRLLGGHIVWPRGFQKGWYYSYKNNSYFYCEYKKSQSIVTINQAKAAFYDRIDWMLVLLKIYYEIKGPVEKKLETFVEKGQELIPETCRGIKQHIDKFKKLFYAFENSIEWLRVFSTFKEFCDFFHLKGSFVNGNYEVIELVPFFPILPYNIDDYISNNVDAISNRNDDIFPSSSNFLM